MHCAFLLLACLGSVGHGRRTKASSVTPGQAAYIAPPPLRRPLTLSASQQGRARASAPVSADEFEEQPDPKPEVPVSANEFEELPGPNPQETEWYKKLMASGKVIKRKTKPKRKRPIDEGKPKKMPKGSGLMDENKVAKMPKGGEEVDEGQPSWLQWEGMRKMDEKAFKEVILEEGKDDDDDAVDWETLYEKRKGMFQDPPTAEAVAKYYPDWAKDITLDKVERDAYEDWVRDLDMQRAKELDVPGRNWDWMYGGEGEIPKFHSACYTPMELADQYDLPVEFILLKLSEAGVPNERLRTNMPVRSFASEEQQEALIDAILGADHISEGMSLRFETLEDIAKEYAEVDVEDILLMCRKHAIPTFLGAQTHLGQSDYKTIITEVEDLYIKRGGYTEEDVKEWQAAIKAHIPKTETWYNKKEGTPYYDPQLQGKWVREDEDIGFGF